MTLRPLLAVRGDRFHHGVGLGNPRQVPQTPLRVPHHHDRLRPLREDTRIAKRGAGGSPGRHRHARWDHGLGSTFLRHGTLLDGDGHFLAMLTTARPSGREVPRRPPPPPRCRVKVTTSPVHTVSDQAVFIPFPVAARRQPMSAPAPHRSSASASGLSGSGQKEADTVWSVVAGLYAAHGDGDVRQVDERLDPEATMWHSEAEALLLGRERPRPAPRRPRRRRARPPGGGLPRLRPRHRRVRPHGPGALLAPGRLRPGGGTASPCVRSGCGTRPCCAGARASGASSTSMKRWVAGGVPGTSTGSARLG